MQIRKRGQRDNDTSGYNSDEEEKSVIRKTIKSFDIHDKVKPTSTPTKTKSHSGAFVSIFLIIVTLLVIWEESSVLLRPETKDTMMVDTEVEEKLVINMDISFYKLRCSEVSVDAVDYNGEQQNSVEHEIYKISRGDKQQDLGMYTKLTDMGDSSGETYLPPGYCGSCYGATRVGSDKCCNTCDELKNTFRRYGRSESLANTLPQCVRENKYGVLPDEYGCRLRGSLTVNKMEGNFHVAAGFSHPQQHQDHVHHIHHINKTEVQGYDISHHINHLSFGTYFYPGQEFPLDNTDYIAPGLGNLVYYLQLVPTVYETQFGEKAITNQFSYYYHYTPVDTSQAHYKLPGVFFKYEFYPMRITYLEVSRSFIEVFIRLCAILGGMYAIVRVIFNIIGSVLSTRSETASTFNDFF